MLYNIPADAYANYWWTPVDWPEDQMLGTLLKRSMIILFIPKWYERLFTPSIPKFGVIVIPFSFGYAFHPLTRYDIHTLHQAFHAFHPLTRFGIHLYTKLFITTFNSN